MSENPDLFDEIIFNELGENEIDPYWDAEELSGAFTLYYNHKDKTGLLYIPGEYNDSGVDPPCYRVSCENYFVYLHFDKVYLSLPGERRHSFAIPSPMKLSDFVTVVKSKYPLELHEGLQYITELRTGDIELGEDIILHIDKDHLMKKIMSLGNLKAFL